MAEDSPQGPKKFPKRVTLNLDDYAHLRALADATGSENPIELINLAITALDWIVQNKQEGRTILAVGDEGDIEDQELVVELPGENDE